MPRHVIGVMLRPEMSLILDDETQELDAIVEELLDEATFGDFVPVLSWRYAREELSTAAGVPAEYAAE
jgi:hypothetical protein